MDAWKLLSSLLECEGREGGGRGRRCPAPAGAAERGAAGGDQDVLLAADRVDAGGVIDPAADHVLPEHPAGLRVERLEDALAADSDEDEAACSRGRTADHCHRLFLLPADRATVDIDRGERPGPGER